MKVPKIDILGVSAYTGEQNRTGVLCNAYSPLKNLEDTHQTLGDFTTQQLNFDLQHPVDIILQDSYDGAVNMLLNDGKNTPKLINSRFSVVDDNEFKIPVHTGHKNTNIYSESTFNIDTSLKAIAQKIPQIKYEGLTQFAGSLPCGAYTFYFKVADADGNESEVLAESGLVQIYIGGSNGPDVHVRMGLEDENSGKSVNFTLTNLDTGFDYVHVLYARSSSGNDQAITDTYYKVLYDYPISKGECKITITGKEQIIGISQQELYTDYADIESVKSQAVVNNVLFFGNIKKQEHDWDALRIASWKIGISCGNSTNIGTIDKDYKFSSDESGEIRGCYYNTFNSYYRVGYWPDEIYRFGVVYIFEDNSLSPVFNIQGVDFNKIPEWKLTDDQLFQQIPQINSSELNSTTGTKNYQWELSPENYYFNEATRQNSKGVVKFPSNLTCFKSSTNGTLIPKPVYIKFDLKYIGNVTKSDDPNNLTPEEFFKKHKIKGYFFVRQKRIPTILAQGIAVGLTKKGNGALPIIKDYNTYAVQSFINDKQILQPEGSNIYVNNENVSINALLVPDAELSEATFNQIFTSNKFALNKIGQYYFRSIDNLSYVSTIKSQQPDIYRKRKLTNVPEDTKILTDGEVYFSTIAGNESEPYKTADVKYTWNKTNPYLLTTSTSVVRGKWGCFVGVGKSEDSDTLSYGSMYNIKNENYADDPESATSLDFQLRIAREDAYSAICDRTEFDPNNLEVTCYRGDCYQSLFTHRMFRNFIDPELPTNNKIVNPACWAQNYAVRDTAIANVNAEYNVYPDNEGWYVTNQESYANEVVSAFEVKEYDENGNEWSWNTDKQIWENSETGETTTQLGGLTSVSAYINAQKSYIKIVKPSEQEQGGIGGILKNIFKSSKWALRGLASINRADVNAVGLGQWITFPICSSKNLALRDVDYSNATEQAQFNRKRSFYPLSKMDVHNPLRDSNVINYAASLSIPHKKYYIIPDVPFIKQEYFTRVLNSLRDSAESITNEFKVMLEAAYQDYTKIYGPITKLVPLGSKMLVVFHHGLGVLALNEQMSQAQNALEYLPLELNLTLSPDYGSMWKDSIISTAKGIYGVDTVAKVIWKVVPGDIPSLQLISNFKLQKFLIDNIDLSEFVTSPFIGRINVKSHYNAFKQDVIFTYYNDILYKFDVNLGLNLSDFGINKDGQLLDKDTNEIYLRDPDDPNSFIQGEKVNAYYDEDSGELINYSKNIENSSNYNSTFKWATGKSWSLCFNEILEKFVTFYDWVPVESENIDNIWFSFDREATNKLVDLGYKGELKECVTPINDYGGRDENYGQNSMDTTFNSTVSVTYFDNNGESPYITFNNINYNYTSGKMLVAGCYVKNGANYKFTFIKPNGKEVLIDNADLIGSDLKGWTFITLQFMDENSQGDIAIKVYIKTHIDEETEQTVVEVNNSTKIQDLAISDIITDIYDTGDVFKSRVYIPSKLELPQYYTVRTLTDSLPLWKHGFAGIYDNADEIKPAFWYGKQHEFNFEFIARKDAVHKVFNNLQIISNKTEPHKFEFEVVGEAYDWYKYKPVLKWIADQITVSTDNEEEYNKQLNEQFIYVLTHPYGELKSNSGFPRMFGMKDADYFEKLPYLKVTDACVPTLDPQIIGEKIGTKDDPDIYLTPEQQGRGDAHSDNTVQCCLVYDKQLNEFRVHTEQLGNDVRKYGRLRGNMQYLEDLWRVEIRPISFKWCYLHEGELEFSRLQETRHRDKYIKIKVRYSGEDLAVIQAISTLFDYSYA